MSFRAYVRTVESACKDSGLTLSMAKLRDAIAKALYGRSYSASVAAEAAGVLPALILPPRHLAEVAIEYGLNPEAFAAAFRPSSPDAFDRHLERMDEFLDQSAPIASRRVRSTIAGLIGYKRGRYWEPKLPLGASELTRMVSFYDKARRIAERLGPEALTAALGVMRETTIGIPWARLDVEEIFLECLRRYVAIEQGPVSKEQIDVLLEAGHIVSAEDPRTGERTAVLTLVNLPMVDAPEVPVLYDIALSIVVDKDKLQADKRPPEARAPLIAQASITASQRQLAAVDAKSLSAMNDTVLLLCSEGDGDNVGPSVSEIEAEGLIERTTLARWEASLDRRGKPGMQQLDIMFDEGGNGQTVGGVFTKDCLHPELFAYLQKHAIPMTAREHQIYWYVFGFECAWAISAASRLRLTANTLHRRREIPSCFPMAACVRYGSTQSPAIVVGFDREFVDAIVIAPAMLHGTRRLVIERDRVTEGSAAFGKAIRAKAKLLDYELDDKDGGFIPIAETYRDAMRLVDAL